MTATRGDAKAVCRRAPEMMADGSVEYFEAIVHPDAVNREATDEPPACRGRVITESELLVLHCTMSGRHARTFCDFGPDGRISTACPPTGKRFATTPTHWFRMAGRKIIEHWANRDDLGTAAALGWTSPSPLYLLRMALAKHHARKRAQAR